MYSYCKNLRLILLGANDIMHPGKENPRAADSGVFFPVDLPQFFESVRPERNKKTGRKKKQGENKCYNFMEVKNILLQRS